MPGGATSANERVALRLVMMDAHRFVETRRAMALVIVANKGMLRSLCKGAYEDAPLFVMLLIFCKVNEG